MDGYLVPAKAAETEFTEKRSRFIGHIFPAGTEAEALAALKKTRETHWDANHNVYAYLIKDGPTRYSDDSEPQGTAGMPVLDVLRRREVTNLLCVVTRYFGGVLLGAGGLVRAYARSASDALDAAGLARMQAWRHVDVPCPYALLARVKTAVERGGGLVLETEYAAGVLVHAMFPAARTEEFLAALTDLTNGTVAGEPGETEYRAFPLEAD